MHALDWLNNTEFVCTQRIALYKTLILLLLFDKHGRILRGAPQPIERVPFASLLLSLQCDLALTHFPL